MTTTELLALIISGVVGLLILVVPFVVLVLVVLRRSKTRQAVASMLGLRQAQHVPRIDGMGVLEGERSGLRVTVEWAAGGNARLPFLAKRLTRIDVEVKPPLMLGVKDLYVAQVEESVRSGTAQQRALFGPVLPLIRSVDEQGDLSISDRRLRWQTGKFESDLELLKKTLESLVGLSQRLAGARNLLPLEPWETAILNILEREASATGLSLDRERLRLLGSRAGYSTLISRSMSPVGPCVQAELSWDGAGLPTAFRVVPRGEHPDLLTTESYGGLLLQSIEVDHGHFDDAFVVQGQSPDEVRQVITQELCAVATTLKAHGVDLWIDGGGLRATVSIQALEAPGQLASLLDELGRIGRALNRRGHGEAPNH